MQKSSSMGSANSILVQGDRHETNDTNEQKLGCSVFVLADSLGMKTMQFLGSITSPELRQTIMRIFRVNGVPDDVYTIYSQFLNWSQEIFRTKDEFLAMVKQEQGNDNVWTGALAWPGHIIRVEKTADGKLTFWDPQRKDKREQSLLLEENKFPMILFTIHT